MRSLAYLCREFDNLHKGENYIEVRPVYHIGFLDFTLFRDHPEFFATYQMRNARDNHLLSDRFNLLVVSLNEIRLATEEDKAYELDKWARFFKAKTWEELRMIAQDNKPMETAAESIYLSNTDDNIYWQCRYREDYLAYQEYQKKEMRKLKRDLRKSREAMAEKDHALAEKDSVIAEKDNAIAEKDSAIAEKDNTIAEKDSVIAERDNAIAERDHAIARKDSEIAALRARLEEAGL